jgi:hypothetical protein
LLFDQLLYLFHFQLPRLYAKKKTINTGEKTLRFWQEIHDESGKLVEIHQKFPVDEGHRKV